MMNITRALPLAAAAALAVAALPAGAAPTAVTSASATVTLKGIAFKPRKVTINRGGTVRWLWRDGSVAHNVVGSGFKSRTQSRGSFSHRFTRRGTFRYRCTLHPGMTGTVVVR